MGTLSARPIWAKANRLLEGHSPRVAVLFAGAGGISLGFQAIGCEIVAAVELDEAARRTHESNFSKLSLRYRCLTNILATDPGTLTAHLAQGSPDLADRIDILLAGPPCQPFSRIGRAKLRDVNGGQSDAWTRDPRVSLLYEVTRFIEALLPLAFVIENVPDLTRFDGRNVAEEIAVAAERTGYQVRYFVLQAAQYGVPQWRERLFIVGIHSDLGIIPHPPVATRAGRVPSGYLTSSQDKVQALAIRPSPHLVGNVETVPDPRPFVNARQALGDLPVIKEHRQTDFRPAKGRARFLPRLLTRRTKRSIYVQALHFWPGFPSLPYLEDHVIRYTPRDWRIFGRMEPGNEYPRAVKIAHRIFYETIRQLRKNKIIILPKSSRWYRLRRKLVPPYDPHKFPNRWWKLRPNVPARTLTAHLSHDSYTHIHYDSSQTRTISIREAARLQSFPDGFRFVGSFNDRMRMIGNAVPPLLARSIAERLLGAVCNAAQRATRREKLVLSAR